MVGAVVMMEGAVKEIMVSKSFEKTLTSKGLRLAYGLAMVGEPCVLGPLLFLRAGSLRHV